MISECKDGAAAVAGIQTHSPDIAVIDAQLPDLTAGQIIQAVRSTNAAVKIIVLGAEADRRAANQVLAAGADAYVLRSGPSRHLNDAIRYIRDGGKYLAPELTRDTHVTCSNAAPGDCSHVSTLQSAFDAQARTVERLEDAIGRAQSAIELLQQRVDQLTSLPAPPDPTRGRVLKMRPRAGTVAVAAIVGILGLMLALFLRPGPDALATAEFSTAGAGASRPWMPGPPASDNVVLCPTRSSRS